MTLSKMILLVEDDGEDVFIFTRALATAEIAIRSWWGEAGESLATIGTIGQKRLNTESGKQFPRLPLA